MTNELVIVTNVVSREISGLDVVNSVNGFYSGAFDKLFSLVLALIALFGVILPILIQIYQKRVMKVSETELKAEMARQLEVEKKNLLETVENKFKVEKTTIEDALQKKSDKILDQVKVASGGIFLLQGNDRLGRNEMTEAAHDFCKAAEFFCEGKAGAELSAAIGNLTLVVKNGIDKGDLDYRGLIKRIENLKEEVRKMDSSRFMQPQLTKLELALEEASKKEKPVNAKK